MSSMGSKMGRMFATGWGRRRAGAVVGLLLVGALTFGVAATATAEGEEADGFWDAIVGGKPTLNVRGRIELADAQGTNFSQAYTLRTRLGYGTKPWFGARLYMNFENVATPTTSLYFTPTELPNSNNLTPIADQPVTQVNVGFFELDRPDWLGSKLVGGRQVIIYDDARFVGNVGWRQNEQTYDGLAFQSTAGLDPLLFKYAYIGHVNRIFGGGGNNPALDDFGSNSQLINASWKVSDAISLTAFAYLLELELAQLPVQQANSNMSFGFRAQGTFELAEKLKLDYEGSYAWQGDYAGQPIDYGANYGYVLLGLTWDALGRLAVGYESLGTDDGVQQFLTPLATAHKFNGWADVYLTNGGPTGLRDFHVIVQPSFLPWQLKSTLAYHLFMDGLDGEIRGNEIDASVKRSFGPHLDVLLKAAYFDSATDDFAETNTYRLWFDVVVKF